MSSHFIHYKEQESLNKAFNVYTRNYQRAFVGKNQATVQIQSSVKKERKLMLNYGNL